MVSACLKHFSRRQVGSTGFVFLLLVLVHAQHASPSISQRAWKHRNQVIFMKINEQPRRR